MKNCDVRSALADLGDEQLLRYSRHILLPEIDVAGQQKLLAARVLVIGLGGLGSPAAMYLAASGVGRLAVADGDDVDLTNLQRQIVHRTDMVGRPKTESAVRTLRALNPDIEIAPIAERLDEIGLHREIARADVVVDATDNFATRYAINRVCVTERTPLVSGAVVRFEGQISVFRADHDASPCYACLFKETNEADEACSQLGVLAPVAGIVGCIQATETIKLLLDIGETLEGKLLLLDARSMEWRSMKLKRDPACAVCGR
ncbi:MAG TPA: molybdopterin-synthase adenylyltransferase MoeB [Burkholderiales bacterium]|nr:molybdopterin-synthase adenylyltransferase MoeB [Burkholderiales bacterium]